MQISARFIHAVLSVDGDVSQLPASYSAAWAPSATSSWPSGSTSQPSEPPGHTLAAAAWTRSSSSACCEGASLAWEGTHSFEEQGQHHDSDVQSQSEIDFCPP